MINLKKIISVFPQYHKYDDITGMLAIELFYPAPRTQKLCNLSLEIDFEKENAYMYFNKNEAILALAFIFAKTRMGFNYDSKNLIYLNGIHLNNFEYDQIINPTNQTTTEPDGSDGVFNIESILNDNIILQKKNKINVDIKNNFGYFCHILAYPKYKDQKDTDDALDETIIKYWKYNY